MYILIEWADVCEGEGRGEWDSAFLTRSQRMPVSLVHRATSEQHFTLRSKCPPTQRGSTFSKWLQWIPWGLRCASRPGELPVWGQQRIPLSFPCPWLSGALRATSVDCRRGKGRNPPGRCSSGSMSCFSADFPAPLWQPLAISGFKVLFCVLYCIQ